MKAAIGNVVSMIRQSLGRSYLFAPESSVNLILPGYTAGGGDPACVEPASGLDRKPVGILYADIADYARLSEEDEEGTHRNLITGMRIMGACVLATGGKVDHFAGDAILAEFRDADSALRCALNAQMSLRDLNVNLAAGKQVRFRVGVNFGEVISDRGDIYGNAVNLTARLEELAYSGGICVSASVRANLKDQSAYKFIGLGKRYLKNISTPVEAFWIEFDADQLVDPVLIDIGRKAVVTS